MQARRISVGEAAAPSLPSRNSPNTRASPSQLSRHQSQVETCQTVGDFLQIELITRHEWLLSSLSQSFLFIKPATSMVHNAAKTLPHNPTFDQGVTFFPNKPCPGFSRRAGLTPAANPEVPVPHLCKGVVKPGGEARSTEPAVCWHRASGPLSCFRGKGEQSLKT